MLDFGTTRQFSIEKLLTIKNFYFTTSLFFMLFLSVNLVSNSETMDAVEDE